MKKIIAAAAAALLAITTFVGCQMESIVEVATPVTWDSAYTLGADVKKALMDGEIIEVEFMNNDSASFKFISSWWSYQNFAAYDETGKAYVNITDGSSWNMKDASNKTVTKIYLKADEGLKAAVNGGQDILFAGNGYTVKTATVKKSDVKFAPTSKDIDDLLDKISELEEEISELEEALENK